MVLSHQGREYAITAAHVLKGCTPHERLTFEDGTTATCSVRLTSCDVALIELPLSAECELSEVGDASFGKAHILVEDVHKPVLISGAGSTLLFFVYFRGQKPAHGESGAALVQHGKVVGMLSSISLLGTGCAISSRAVLDELMRA